MVIIVIDIKEKVIARRFVEEDICQGGKAFSSISIINLEQVISF